MKFFKRYMVLLAVSTALPISAAHAYLDAASASIAVQAIIGVVATYILTGKYYLAKVKSVFSRKKNHDVASDAAAD